MPDGLTAWLPWLYGLGAMGSVASLISLVIILRDLPSARQAAEAAQDAAQRAQKGLDERLRIADASACAQLAREIETHLRDPQDWTAAFYRAQKLYVLMLELEAIPSTAGSPTPASFRTMVEQMCELRNVLGRVIGDDEYRAKRERGFDHEAANTTLRMVQDGMHKWKACLKRTVVEGTLSE